MSVKTAVRHYRFVPIVESLEPRMALDNNSTGPDGIDSSGLGLTGAGILIGQTELGRPTQVDFDIPFQVDVWPQQVYVRDGDAVANADVALPAPIGYHALSVAGAMIANGPDEKGVAPGALLHASADRVTGPLNELYALTAMQHVASRNSNSVPAVNLSWSLEVGILGLNGSSEVSVGTDYLARAHDTLFTIAPNNAGGMDQIPSDAYNALVVSAAERVGGMGRFRKVHTPAPIADDNRSLVHLIAPGVGLTLPSIVAGQPDYETRTGSSYAAPHAAGTVALLQQASSAPGGYLQARHHEVMKAILINSAEKVEGRLGMTRTVLKVNGTSTWGNSSAVDAPGTPAEETARQAIPLDPEMGAGFLNANRALMQLNGGQYEPMTAAGARGWDYHNINTDGGFVKYQLPRLRGGSWVSLTLTWDRVVPKEENPAVMNNDPNLWNYDGTNRDRFGLARLANLDLFLMPAGAENIGQKIWASNSTLYNVEHIFFHLPAGNAAYGPSRHRRSTFQPEWSPDRFHHYRLPRKLQL